MLHFQERYAIFQEGGTFLNVFVDVVSTATPTKTSLNFILFVLLRDYFNSFNFYRNGELPGNQTGRSGVQVLKN